MIILYILLAIIGSLGLAIFLDLYLLPFIVRKWAFYSMSKKLAKMAKKYDGETGEALRDISRQLMELIRSESLIDED